MNRFVLTIVLAVCPFVSAFAQDRGTIEGTVTDASGAVVPAANVKVVQLGTNASWNIEANTVGRYFAPNLPLGSYRVTVQKLGFSTANSPTLEVRSQTTVRVDIKLQVGAVAENVEVSAQAELIDTASTTRAASLTTKQIEELPLISFGQKADIASYLKYLPGTESSSSTAPVVDGSQTYGAEVFVDGAPASDGVFRGSMLGNGGAVNHYGEFNIVTNSFSAEYGRTGTWFYSVTIKSGTNDLHGSIYDNFVNDKLNARDFFQAKRQVVRQNNGGYTIGGPVYFPKLYNGRNKTFFFFGHDLFYSTGQMQGNLLTIPSMAFRQGDFSSVGAIYDPASADASGIRTQFPGNQISLTRFSTVSKNILALMPQPDLPGNLNNWRNRTGSGIGNYPADPMQNNFSITGKVDHSFSENEKLSVSYTDEYRPRKIAGRGWGLDSPLEGLQDQPLHSRTGRISLDSIIRSNLINHITLGYDRYLNPAFDASRGQGWDTKLGLLGQPFDTGAFPSVGFSGGTISPLGIGGGQYSNLGTVRWSFGETLSWMKGHHFVKFGGNYWFEGRNDNAKATGNGQWTFTNQITSQLNNAALGNSFASFLLGAPGTAYTKGPTYMSTRLPYQALFVQEEWHATAKLSLSLGLRWENNSPPYDKYNRFANFSPSTPNPGAGNIPGALVYAGNGTGTINARTTLPVWHKGFSPRTGLAYQFSEKLVVRASLGLFFNPPGMNALTLQGWGVQNTLSSPNGYTPAYNWDSTYPSFQTTAALDPSSLNAQVIHYYDSTYTRPGQTASWTAGFQYQLARNSVLDFTYIGHKGTHLEADTLGNPDVLDPKYLSLGSLLTERADSANAVAAGIRLPWTGFTSFALPTVGQALRAYPQYSNVLLLRPKIGEDRYNSLQGKLTRRASNGLMVMTSFAWTKHMTNAPSISPAPTFQFGNGIQNPYDLKGNISVSETTLPLDVKLTFSYDLPLGKGKHFLDSSGIVNTLFGGWQVVMYIERGSGRALSVTTNNNLAGFGYSVKRANVDSSKPLTLQTSSGDFNPATDRYINAAAFSSPAAYALGNLPRTMDWMRSWPLEAEAASVNKTIKFHERGSVKIGADFNNPFNFVRWASPVTNVAAANFGAVTSSAAGRQIQLVLQILF
jgi:hypothetical protein